MGLPSRPVTVTFTTTTLAVVEKVGFAAAAQVAAPEATPPSIACQGSQNRNLNTDGQPSASRPAEIGRP